MSDRLRILLTCVVLAALIFAVRLIHRKKLNLNYSLLWLFLAVAMLIAVIFPELIYGLARLIGIEVPINMLLLAFAFFSLVMLFYLTTIVSKDNEKSRAMTQQLAMLEKRVRELEARLKEKEG